MMPNANLRNRHARAHGLSPRHTLVLPWSVWAKGGRQLPSPGPSSRVLRFKIDGMVTFVRSIEGELGVDGA